MNEPFQFNKSEPNKWEEGDVSTYWRVYATLTHDNGEMEHITVFIAHNTMMEELDRLHCVYLEIDCENGTELCKTLYFANTELAKETATAILHDNAVRPGWWTRPPLPKTTWSDTDEIIRYKREKWAELPDVLIQK